MNTNLKKVYNVIKAGTRKGNQIHLTYKEISQASGLQITMVSSCIRILTDRNIIESTNHLDERGRAKCNSYKILKLIEGDLK